MHSLRKYLIDIGESTSEFALRVGASRQTIYRICKGDQSPKPELARRIVEASGRAVTLEDLYREAPDAGQVITIDPATQKSTLDIEGIRIALAIVCNHYALKDKAFPSDADLKIAGQAVIDTYTALRPISNREGNVRLRQALWPVLEEVLSSCAGPLPSTSIDRAADLAMQFYFQTWSISQHHR